MMLQFGRQLELEQQQLEPQLVQQLEWLEPQQQLVELELQLGLVGPQQLVELEPQLELVELEPRQLVEPQQQLVELELQLGLVGPLQLVVQPVLLLVELILRQLEVHLQP